MTTVILDTNALLMPFQFNINLDRELQRLFGDPEVYVPSSVMDELRELNRKNALALAKKYKEISVEKPRDDGVLEAAEKINAVIVTNDKELKKTAKEKGITVVFLRKKSYLAVEGEHI